MTKTYTFDIKVAIVGCVSVGKSTVLNALLGDKFNQVALKRTTAGVNVFRIIQPNQQNEIESSEEDSNPEEEEWSTIVDDGKVQEADAVHEEIAKDNEELQLTENVEETTFDIEVPYPICKMRKDTQLVLIDIPGIHEAESSKQYKDYVESNWKTFDCVVVVMDAIQGVNTQEQLDLLEFVQQNNQSTDIPIIILGNKMDDFDNEDTIYQIEETRRKIIEIFGIYQIEETRRKIIEIFGNVDCDSMPSTAKDMHRRQSGTANGEGTKTVFVPMSAKNVVTYRKAASIDLEQLDDPKYQDIVDKIGYDEYGQMWFREKDHEKLANVKKILQDTAELDQRIAGTNFNFFLESLSGFVGGDAKQRDILSIRIDNELEGIRFDSSGEAKIITEMIFELFKKSKAIGRNKNEALQSTFWAVYKDFEDEGFRLLEKKVYPTILKERFLELECYHQMTLLLRWEEQSVQAISAMKALLRRQLDFLLNKLEAWSFESYCRAAGAKSESYGRSICSSCARKKCRRGGYYEDSDHCLRVVNESYTHAYYKICEPHGSMAMVWREGWKVPENITWANLSPNDWIVMLDSLSLVWNQAPFLEEFGNERLELKSALVTFLSTFRPISGIFSDSITMSPLTRICLHAYREEILKKNKNLQSRIKMSTSLSEAPHWGFLASRYIDFCNDNDQQK